MIFFKYQKFYLLVFTLEILTKWYLVSKKILLTRAAYGKKWASGLEKRYKVT